MESEARLIRKLLNGAAEQIYCGMGICIWRLTWSKPLKLFFIGKNFVNPSGEFFYTTISMAPLESEKPDESIIFVKKGFLRKKVLMIDTPSVEMRNIAMSRLKIIEETLLKSPYTRIDIRISSFNHDALKIHYKRTLLITGFTEPVLTVRPSVLFKKIIDTNTTLIELFFNSLNL